MKMYLDDKAEEEPVYVWNCGLETVYSKPTGNVFLAMVFVDRRF